MNVTMDIVSIQLVTFDDRTGAARRVERLEISSPLTGSGMPGDNLR
jgi:hypothetical protein